jgi:WD40 repeat protein
LAGIFISYRRDESGYAGRLFDRLIARFGRDQVFMDIDMLKPGEDFVDVLQRTVTACDTLIAIIGRQWLTAADGKGLRRLENPDDFVRLEIVTALEAGIRVIPALVGGAQMPPSASLPDPLKTLSRRHAITLSDTGFHAAVQKLIETLESNIASSRGQKAGGDVFNAQLVPQLGHAWWIVCAAIFPDGRRIVSGGGSGELIAWETESGLLLRSFDNGRGTVNAVAVLPDGQRVAAASEDGTIRIWQADDGRELHVLRGHTRGVESLSPVPGGRWIVSGGEDTTIRVWDAITGVQIHSLTGHSARVNAVAVSQDGCLIASGSDDGTVRLWDVVSLRQIQTMRLGNDRRGEVKSVAVSADSKWVASGGADGIVRIWDAATGAEVRALCGHTNWVVDVQVSTDGRRVFSVADTTLRVWNLATGDEIRVMSYPYPTRFVTILPDDRRLATAAGSGPLEILDSSTGTVIRSMADGHRYLDFAVPSLSTGLIAAGGGDRIVRIWSTESGRLMHALECTANVRSVAVSPDGRWLATCEADNDHTIRIWDIASGRQLRTFRFDQSAYCLAVGPNAHWMVACGQEGAWTFDLSTGRTIVERLCSGESSSLIDRLTASPSLAMAPNGGFVISTSGQRGDPLTAWNPQTGTVVRTLDSVSPSHYYGDVLVTPDSRAILCKAREGPRLRTVDVSSERELTIFESPQAVISFAISPDGRSVVAGTTEGVRLWERTSGRPMHLTGPLAQEVRLQSVAFVDDGRLVSAHSNGSARLWAVHTGELLVTFDKVGDADFLTHTPDGYYVASPEGDAAVAFRDGARVSTRESLKSQYRRPDVVRARVKKQR